MSVTNPCAHIICGSLGAECLVESGKIQCPFCGEGNFDLVGLKGHILRYCAEFESAGEPPPNPFCAGRGA